MDDRSDRQPPLKIGLFSTEGQRFLKEVINIVDLRLQLDDNPDTFVDAATSANKETVVSQGSVNSTDSNYYGCNVCSFQCVNYNEQRSHFQSEWHLFNLRRRLRSKQTVTKESYECILAGEKGEKTNGSDVSSTSSSSSDEEIEEEEPQSISNCGKKGAIGGSVLFVTKDRKVVACYRALLTSLRSYQVESESLLTNLRQLQSGSCVWIILILSGGHFAGAVFDSSTLKDEAVAHKTVHRYTIRAKQGCSQATRDAQQQSKPKSAGANLRRYNEAALCQDIRNILTSWDGYVRRASGVFLRCSVYKRHIFYAGSEPLFSKTDDRIRTIPFPTRKPTYEETKRVRNELATLYVYESYEALLSHDQRRPVEAGEKLPVRDRAGKGSPMKPEQRSEHSLERNVKKLPPAKEAGTTAVDAQEAPCNAGRQNKARTNKPIENARPNELQLPQELRQQIYTSCRRGDAEAVRKLISERPADDVRHIRNYLSSPVNDKDGSTFLHLASASGHLDMLRFLLDVGCDPRIKNVDKRVPYQVANGRPTRQVFTKFREDYPERWDWNASQIPEPVDPETEAARKAKIAERRKTVTKGKAEKLREKKEADAKAREEEAEKLRYLKLSDREKRALAAEKRWKTQLDENKRDGTTEETANVILSRCFRCGTDITGIVPFEYSENRFCTMKCLKEHRASSS